MGVLDLKVAVTCGASPIMLDVVLLLRRVKSIKSIVLLDAEPIQFAHGCETAIIPLGSHPDYAEAIYSIQKKYGIDYFFIGSDEEAMALSTTSWAAKISHIDTQENTTLILNKYKLHLTLGNDFVPFFALCQSKEELVAMVQRFGSVIERPITGRGSRGLRHLISRKSQEYPAAIPLGDISFSEDTFQTQFLKGDKYSADCIFDQGVLKTCMIRNNGPSVKYRPPTMTAIACIDPEVYLFAQRIGQKLGLNGFHQIESGKDENGKVLLIEINPRLDATLSITQCYKENFYELLLNRASVGLMLPVKPIFKRFFQVQVI